MIRPQAILLIGPTGSGKSPLGDLLERRGPWGRSWIHFDFGRQLRTAARRGGAAVLSADELAVVRWVLDKGLLLEDDHFPIARKILTRFIGSHRPAFSSPDSALLILNGLPRHVGQARDLAEMIDILAVIHLNCPPDVSRLRIRANADGDRDGRQDDRSEDIALKHQLFEHRTRPLVDYCRARGASVIEVDVTIDTTPVEALQIVSRARF